ncbi:MAG: 50S ribosomal protein L33 [Candidatus Izemoplasmatales bacterium]|jgi:large subunit ribosomal protein L33
MMIFLTFPTFFDTVIKASEMINMKGKVALICQECLSRNYEIKKQEHRSTRFEATKYCNKCKKHTLHKEGK